LPHKKMKFMVVQKHKDGGYQFVMITEWKACKGDMGYDVATAIDWPTFLM
jgi:hypothetical protein